LKQFAAFPEVPMQECKGQACCRTRQRRRIS